MLYLLFITISSFDSVYLCQRILCCLLFQIKPTIIIVKSYLHCLLVSTLLHLGSIKLVLHGVQSVNYCMLFVTGTTLKIRLKGQKVSGVGKGLTLWTSRTKHKNNPREDKNQLGSVNGDLMMNSC